MAPARSRALIVAGPRHGVGVHLNGEQVRPDLVMQVAGDFGPFFFLQCQSICFCSR